MCPPQAVNIDITVIPLHISPKGFRRSATSWTRGLRAPTRLIPVRIAYRKSKTRTKNRLQETCNRSSLDIVDVRKTASSKFTTCRTAIVPVVVPTIRSVQSCIQLHRYRVVVHVEARVPYFKVAKMFSSDDIGPDNASSNDGTRQVETEPHKRCPAPFDWTLLTPLPTERRAGLHQDTGCAEARSQGTVSVPPGCNAAGDGHLVPLSDTEYSLPVDPGVPAAEEAYSLASAKIASCEYEVVLPEGNIGRGTDLIRQLPALDPRWNDEQQAIYKYLASLAPITIQKAAQRLRRYDIVGARAHRPSTRGSRRTFESELRRGAMLNALHPNHVIAIYWMNRCAIGDFPMPQAAIAGIENGGGGVIFECEGSKPRQGRLRRLKELCDGWFEESLRATETVTPRLRAGHLILALSGCRTCEVADTRAEWDIAARRMTLFIPIAKQKDATKKGSFRQMSFLATGDNEQLVDELIHILVADGSITRDVPAKALQNLIARTSRKLWPEQVPGLNSSCYRNLLIADLKKDGVARKQIADLLGHTTTKTGSMYGTWAQGRKRRRGYLELPSDSNIDQYAMNMDACRPRPAG